MTPRQVNLSLRNPCLFGSLRWTNQSQKKVQSKEPIDTTAITDLGLSLHPHPTQLPREGPRQQPLPQARGLLELLGIRGLRVSTAYQCPLYLVW